MSAGILAVGSSAVLGCVIRGIIIAYCIVCLFTLQVCLWLTVASSVADKTKDKLNKLNRTQNNEDDGEKAKLASKLNKRLGLCNKVVSAGDKLLGCALSK